MRNQASDESPSVLRERVTSEGGTNAAVLAVIKERGVQQAPIDAGRAARDHGAELGNQADRKQSVVFFRSSATEVRSSAGDV